ncbi:IclR family transcriptional regulator [Pseudofrankia inefficax]|uniref:Glycerol operon regulatory protein n=1 Tax=Pseudofrankia inefficax (strain DSM 45817 / CECT 9037 / DDB 130130 / EuI1c) TaxID=298654 RepID=E3J2H4_PSEI1|nr:IclR family transcriptional regulator [Pseudofrankia inefficax]ADP79346.1 transcriptional regulator, IclR family [Pseudofrankia inefficax]
MSNSETALVQSVDRAVTVLEILARGGEAGVTEVAAELGVHKSTASRLLGALEHRGLVEQPRGRGKYRLGLGIARLAGAVTAQFDLGHASREVCERLADELGETVNVAIVDRGFAVNISQVRGPAAVASHNWVGQRTPLHATSSGKVLLSTLPPDERDRLVKDPLERFTPHTITDPAVLAAELRDVADRGWASTREELEIGLNAVAAPIRGWGGQLRAAVSVSGPTYRLPEGSFPEVAEAVRRAATDINAAVGHLS